MVLPITVLGVIGMDIVSRELRQRTYERLEQAQGSAQALLADRERDLSQRVAQRAADDLGPLVAEGPAALEAALRDFRVADRIDVLVVAGPGGEIMAAARDEPRFAPGQRVASNEQVLAGTEPRTWLTATAAIPGGDGQPAGRLVGAVWIDWTLLRQPFRSPDVDFTVASGSQAVATTAEPDPVPASVDGRSVARVGGASSYVVAGTIPSTSLRLLASTPRAPVLAVRRDIGLVLAVLMLIVVLLVVLVGWRESGVMTRPVQELVQAALAVSQGDLDQRVEPSGDREIATLGQAFNRMTDNLREYLAQLEQSRTEFRQALARLGDVLVSTHDLPRIIDVVLEAGVLTLRADAAVFYDVIGSPAGGRLRARAARGPDGLVGLELEGTGVAGAAARRNTTVAFPGQAAPAGGEPDMAAALAVPVISQGRLIGVLAVYGRQTGATFSEADTETLQTLARQAEVAIENVKLHDEARRQAITDGLTGLWNRRQFDLRLREALQRANRFGEPFGVVFVDIDHFKQVNDRYGHAAGDDTLVWLAERLIDATRDVDVVARWGGEEFALLLPRSGVEETERVAERVRAAVSAAPNVFEGKVIPLTVSAGFACHPVHGTTAHDLVKAADEALYRAKTAGRNRVEEAGPAGSHKDVVA